MIGYLDDIDAEAAARARARYACLQPFERTQRYGYAVASGLSPSCDREAVEQLVDLQRTGDAFLRRDGYAAEDEQFYAEQNARLVIGAERYYRSMFSAPEASWNLRDQHMADTLERLLDHLEQRSPGARIVVWAHNSHVGDARWTEMHRRRELNLGQLVRERFDRDSYLLGFTTYTGTVSAARNRDEPVERRRVRPALEGSFEHLFHLTSVPDFALLLRDGRRAADHLTAARLHPDGDVGHRHGR